MISTLRTVDTKKCHVVAQFLGIELDIWLGLEIFRGLGRGIFLALGLDPYCGL